MHLVTPTPGTFTSQELERLAMYRAAVAAGFYTDDVPGVASTVAADEAEDDAHQLADDVPKGGPTDTATSDPTAR